MALNLGKSHPQVTLHYKFDALELHLVDVDIEAIICVAQALLFDVLFFRADLPQNTLDQAELERQKFGSHLLIMQ